MTPIPLTSHRWGRLRQRAHDGRRTRQHIKLALQAVALTEEAAAES